MKSSNHPQNAPSEINELQADFKPSDGAISAPDWLSLASRCEAATGPDREIDAAILTALGWSYENVADGCFAWLDRHGGVVASTLLITGSIDAITALIRSELPGGSWQAGEISREHEDGEEGPEGGWGRVFLNCQDERDEIEFIVSGRPTPALALDAAFCRAMHAKGARS